MRNVFRTGVMALCVAAGIAAAPRAEAAAYLTAADWYGALTDAVADYGGITLSQLPSYTVEYQDSFGTWKPGEPNAVVVGTAGYPYNDPDKVLSRPRLDPYSGSTLGSRFTCESFTFGCLGAYRVTFTFPYEIIGFAGQLQLGGDLLPDSTDMPELQVADWIAAGGWKPGSTTFYGQMLDQPSSVFTVSWGARREQGTDALALFTLANTTVVRADTTTAVPEPASIALFGMGLAGLGMVARRRRG